MGRVCNTLPLPEVCASHLPILINANFELTPSRRDIWWGTDVVTSAEKFRSKWNQVMMRHEVAPCYASLLLELCRTKYLSWHKNMIQAYWPRDVPENSMWEFLKESTLEQIKGLPVLGSGWHKGMFGSWVGGEGIGMCLQCNCI